MTSSSSSMVHRRKGKAERYSTEEAVALSSPSSSGCPHAERESCLRQIKHNITYLSAFIATSIAIAFFSSNSSLNHSSGVSGEVETQADLLGGESTLQALRKGAAVFSFCLFAMAMMDVFPLIVTAETHRHRATFKQSNSSLSSHLKDLTAQARGFTASLLGTKVVSAAVFGFFGSDLFFFPAEGGVSLLLHPLRTAEWAVSGGAVMLVLGRCALGSKSSSPVSKRVKSQSVWTTVVTFLVPLALHWGTGTGSQVMRCVLSFAAALLALLSALLCVGLIRAVSTADEQRWAYSGSSGLGLTSRQRSVLVYVKSFLLATSPLANIARVLTVLVTGRAPVVGFRLFSLAEGQMALLAMDAALKTAQTALLLFGTSCIAEVLSRPQTEGGSLSGGSRQTEGGAFVFPEVVELDSNLRDQLEALRKRNNELRQQKIRRLMEWSQQQKASSQPPSPSGSGSLSEQESGVAEAEAEGGRNESRRMWLMSSVKEEEKEEGEKAEEENQVAVTTELSSSSANAVADSPTLIFPSTSPPPEERKSHRDRLRLKQQQQITRLATETPSDTDSNPSPPPKSPTGSEQTYMLFETRPLVGDPLPSTCSTMSMSMSETDSDDSVSTDDSGWQVEAQAEAAASEALEVCQRKATHFRARRLQHKPSTTTSASPSADAKSCYKNSLLRSRFQNEEVPEAVLRFVTEQYAKQDYPLVSL
uniref:Transmembrane protein n=1 Tax=Chromera velia CCMP2878 TaxID=1169474 RepID=A0A0G4FQC2_9ALVE|eukprot:Cvel_3631.t1-p1 / transcript=Cvel_3631.t1 / gene=Cvel_3631 / organism=Chromera_velia_CCMP2878 / gene_product=hypothetical protein / transcript_product=hypothetical protein / location=Cvel_scaffold149:73411-76804(-) / protein_length=702 / sequence_SO=supercontig / SO=protein_coding / is_pseudo=false